MIWMTRSFGIEVAVHTACITSSDEGDEGDDDDDDDDDVVFFVDMLLLYVYSSFNIATLSSSLFNGNETTI